MKQVSALLRFHLLLLAMAVSIAVSGAARAESLADTLVSAYRNSDLLDQNRALLRAADEDVAQAVSDLRPIVNWSADVTRSFSEREIGGVTTDTSSTDATLAISADLLLYDFGQSDFQIEATKETVLATRQTLRSIEQQVLLRAVRAFMNVRRNMEFVSLRENNLRLLRQELQAARDRFDVGEVTRTDVAQAEARLAEAQSGLAGARGDLKQAVEEFRVAVGRPPGDLRQPRQLPDLSGDEDAAKAIAVRKHPDVLKERHDVAAAELTVKAAEAAMKPSISLTGRIGASEELGGADHTRSGSLGVEMRGPIYQGGLLSSVKRQAMARRDAQRGALHLSRLQVAQDVGNAYAVLRAARATQAASREQVRAAEVAFRGAREEAKLGARTTLDVLDAEQDLLDARVRVVSTQADLYIAAYQVLAARGELTVKDLNLGIQTYDASAYYNMVKDAPAELSPQGRKLDRVLRALGKD
jgi:outer membrane protein